MATRTKLASALRHLALMLAVIGVCLNPALQELALGWAADSGCHTCPCATADEEHPENTDEGGAARGGVLLERNESDGKSQHAWHHSSDHQCPDDCTDCHCQFGHAWAVLPFGVEFVSFGAVDVSTAVGPPERIFIETRAGIFRPPRQVA